MSTFCRPMLEGGYEGRPSHQGVFYIVGKLPTSNPISKLPCQKTPDLKTCRKLQEGPLQNNSIRSKGGVLEMHPGSSLHQQRRSTSVHIPAGRSPAF